MLYKYEFSPPNPPFGAYQRRMCEEVGIDRCACVHLREGWGSKCSDLIIIYSQRENERRERESDFYGSKVVRSWLRGFNSVFSIRGFS